MKKDVAESLWMLIMRAADLSRNYAFAISEGEFEKVTMAQQHVLSAVYSNPGPGLMIKDIALQLNLTPGAVSQTVESLVKMDAVERVASEHDRRAVIIRPSKKGMGLRELLGKRINPVMRRALANATAAETATFVKIMSGIVDTMLELNGAERKSRSTRLHTVEEVK